MKDEQYRINCDRTGRRTLNDIISNGDDYVAENQREVSGFKQIYGNNEIRIAEDDGRQARHLLRLNLDVSEVIKDLKAVQREAREATKALRELEAVKARVIVNEKDAR